MGVEGASVCVLMGDYNTPAAVLTEAVSAILAQTYRDLELVIVDDGSKTSTASRLLGVVDPRIRVITNPRNLGLGRALNRGLSEIRSDLVVRADSDDVAAPDYVAVMVSAARAHPEFSAISGRVQEFGSDGHVGAIVGTPGEKRAREVLSFDALVHPASMYRRQDVLEVGGYPDYNRAEDLALWCELLLSRKRLLVIPDVLVRYRVEDADFAKRSLRRRGGELRARLHYSPLLHERALGYAMIAQSIAAGILPGKAVRWFREHLQRSAVS